MPEYQTHTDWQDMLPEYIAGTLPDAARHALEDHLANCHECREAADDWRDIATITRKAAQSRRTQLPPLQIPFSKADAPNGRGVYLPEKPIKENRSVSINPNIISVPKNKRAVSRRPIPLTLVAATTLVLLIVGLLLATMSRNASFLGAPQGYSVPALVQIDSENADDVAPLYTISMDDNVRGLYWSPDGSKFALVPSAVNVTYIIDLNHPDHEARPYAGVFGTWMPDGQTFVTLQPDAVLVHSADTGRELTRFDYTGRMPQRAEWVNEDSFLVVYNGGVDHISLSRDTVIESYADAMEYTLLTNEVPLGETGYHLEVYENTLSGLPTSYDVQAEDRELTLAPFINRPVAGLNITRSTYQATLTDGVTYIWNADTGVEIFQFPQDTMPLSNLMVNPDATIAVARESNSDAVHIWDLTEGVRSALLDDGSVPPMLWFEPAWYSTNGMYFVTQQGSTLLIWGVAETTRIPREIRLPATQQILPVTLTPTFTPTPIPTLPAPSPTWIPTATPVGGVGSGATSCLVHVVQAGDTLLSIATQYNVDPAALATINRIDESMSVVVGDALIIPIGGCDPAFDGGMPIHPTPISGEGQPTVISPADATGTPIQSAPIGGQPTVPPGECLITTIEDVDAYNHPDTGGSVIMHVPAGTDVIGRLETGGWYMVLNTEINRVGWVEASAVTVEGEVCDHLPAPTPTHVP